MPRRVVPALVISLHSRVLARCSSIILIISVTVLQLHNPGRDQASGRLLQRIYP